MKIKGRYFYINLHQRTNVRVLFWVTGQKMLGNIEWNHRIYAHKIDRRWIGGKSSSRNKRRKN